MNIFLAAISKNNFVPFTLKNHPRRLHIAMDPWLCLWRIRFVFFTLANLSSRHVCIFKILCVPKPALDGLDRKNTESVYRSVELAGFFFNYYCQVHRKSELKNQSAALFIEFLCAQQIATNRRWLLFFVPKNVANPTQRLFWTRIG